MCRDRKDLAFMRMKSWETEKQLSNHARVLRYIFRNQPVSRSEIGEDLSLPRSMVTGITTTLVDQGIVRELGKAETAEDGALGRRRLLIGICPEARYAVGVEIALRHFRFCLTDLAGNVIDRLCYAPNAEQIAQVNRAICDGVHQLLARNPGPAEQVIGVGVALPGHLNPQSGGMVSHSTLWSGFNAHALAQALDCRVTAENNVRSMAYERYLFDIESCPENFAFLHVGPGIVCADFKGGVLNSGGYISGEIGHTISNPDGQRCECGKTGCLQTYASESWILKKARLIHASAPRSALRSLAADPGDITLDTVLTAYKLGDELVIREIRDAVRYLAIAAANLAIIMGTEKLYLHSRMFQNSILKDELKASIESQLTFVDKKGSENVEILEFQPERAAIGAAALAIDRLFIGK